MEMNFCRRCGQALTISGESYICENGHILYANPAPTVGVFLVDAEKNVILSVRGIEPRKGMLDCFGGFVDTGETFEQAAVRELKEETGLKPSDYSNLIYLTSGAAGYPYGGETREVLSSFYYASLSPEAVINPQDDVADIRVLRPDQVNLEDFGDSDAKDGFVSLAKALS